MSEFDYSRFVRLGTQYLRKYGVPVTLRSRTETYSTETMSTVKVDVVQYTYGVWDDYTVTERANTLIRLEDRRLWLAAEGLNPGPDAGDIIETPGNKPYTVVRVSAIQPAETVILYDLQVR